MSNPPTPGISMPNVVVGKDLQSSGYVRLDVPAPVDTVVTIDSHDASKVLLSADPEKTTYGKLVAA